MSKECNEDCHFNGVEWVEKYKNEFKPPISNKMMFNHQLILFFLQGPNQRDDFHIENGEEIFYMFKGNMKLKTLQNGKYVDILINEGDLFILPSRVFHSPRRPNNSLGFVIERKRDMNIDIDGLVFFDEPETNIIHEVYIHIENFETQLREIAVQALKDVEDKVKKVALKYQPIRDPPIQQRSHFSLMDPICLNKFLLENERKIQSESSVMISPPFYQSKIEILSNKEFKFVTYLYDTLFWMFKGNATLYIDDSETVNLKQMDYYLVKEGKSVLVKVKPNQILIKIKMENH